MPHFAFRMIAAAVYAVSVASVSSAATHEQRSSILIFPRVVANEQQDTVIQLVNRGFLPAYATCFYIGAFGDPTEEALIEVDLRLETQQTTHWSASRGRPVDPSDLVCQLSLADCDGAGFDPGDIPPVPAGFEGQLVCVQVDASGAPWSGNTLIGAARILDAQSGDIESYAAIGLRGFDTNDGNDSLCLGGSVRARCPKGAEYDACPLRWFAIHPTDDPDGGVSSTATSLTLVPCNLDLDRFDGRSLTVSFRVTNELEQTLSASTTVTGYRSIPLAETSVVFTRDVLGGDLTKTVLRSVGDGGFVGLSEIRTMADGSSTVVGLHGDPTRPGAALIQLPE